MLFENWHATLDDALRAAVAYLVVVLENDGDWSVVRRRDCGADRSAFEALAIPEPTAG